MKVRELYKQREEQQLSHEEEMKSILEECEEKSQRYNLFYMCLSK